MIYITISFKRTYGQASLVMPVFRELQEAWHPEIVVGWVLRAIGKNALKAERAVFLGKCAIPMAAGFSSMFPETPKLVYSTLPERDTKKIRNARILYGTHPAQSRANMKNSSAAKEWLKGTSGNLVAFVSGGTSALLSSPPPGWTLKEVAEVEGALLASGVPIGKINAVRMSLSTLKAGGMAELVKPFFVRSFLWCDVPKEESRVTGSAPFWSNPFRSKDAPAKILKEYGIVPPKPVPERNSFREVPGSGVFRLADGETMTEDFVRRLGGKGISARKVNIPEGTAAEKAAKLISSAAGKADRPSVLVGGGEYPVAVRGKGRGGRCSHLAALVAKELRDKKRWSFAAVATDGEDGGGGAGAFVCDESLPSTGEIDDAIKRSDTAALFERHGGLVPRASTGNNLRDLWFLVLEEES